MEDYPPCHHLYGVVRSLMGKLQGQVKHIEIMAKCARTRKNFLYEGVCCISFPLAGGKG